MTAEEAQHLADCIAAYRKAIELDATDVRSELGLAWMLAQQGKYANELPADYFGDPKASDAEKAEWKRTIEQLADDDPRGARNGQ